MWAYLPYGPFATLDAWIAWAEPMARSEDPLFFAIIDRATGRGPRASPRTSRIDPEHGSIEVGHLALLAALQRTPAATEAMYLMMRRAFEAGLPALRVEVRQPERAVRAAAARARLLATRACSASTGW